MEPHGGPQAFAAQEPAPHRRLGLARGTVVAPNDPWHAGTPAVGPRRTVMDDLRIREAQHDEEFAAWFDEFLRTRQDEDDGRRADPE